MIRSGVSEMTQDYLIGELSVRLELLQATAPQPTGEVARLRGEVARLRGAVESGPPSWLTAAMVHAIILADHMCWDSLTRGDGPAFARQAELSAELRQFGICARLLSDR